MSYKCCEHLLRSINLSSEGYKYCNEVWEGPEYISYKEENAFEKNEERRLQIIKDMQNGLIPERCKLCPILSDTEETIQDNKINKITVFNWKHCNAACYYCSVGSEFDGKIRKSSYYDSLPVIEKLIKEGRITKDTFVAFMGGEPTLLEEFTPIAKLLLDKNCKIEILSNGILYNPLISNILNADNNNSVCISLDCGTRETYKKIKRVDKFEEVKSTIKRYITETGKNSHRIKLKYIVLPVMNDNKKEIDAWFDFCKEVGVTTVSRAVNHLQSKTNSKNTTIEKSVLESYAYIKTKAEKSGFSLMPEPWADAIVENEVYNCRKVGTLTKYISKIKFSFGIK